MSPNSSRHSNHLIVAIMGYGASYLSVFARILNEEASRHGFQCVVVNSDDSLNNLSDIEKADVIFIYSHELPREVEKGIEESKAIVIAASESLLPLSRASPEALLKAAMFIKIGGEENLRGLARLLLKEAGVNLDVPEPKEVPWHGIYHPKLGYFDDLRRYLESYYHADKPLVCVMYHRTLWLYGL
ncbi:MAG: cobaltochelatase subunit CobN, partial [Candidatus Nezhaarchaeales archaeon]